MLSADDTGDSRPRNETGEELVLYIYGAPPEQEGADFFDDPGDL